MARPTWDVPTRRHVISTGAAGVALRMLALPVWANPDAMRTVIRDALGDTPITPGRVTLELPQLAENGNSVPLRVRVDSPMTAADYVKSIYIFSEQNPSPNVVRFHLSPRSGRAQVRSTIRLAGTQDILAVARMSDGSCWSGAANVLVTLAACIDGT